jgi:2-polyprenyl-6-hydroxyphenyl methylase / 3-demethylubiquinone-9 3-methyltransferase
MPGIDNAYYNRAGDLWWDERAPLSLLLALNPWRFGYYRTVLERLGIDPHDQPTLDVGCGGGFLAEEFARLGCRVMGVDPSAPSLVTARAHATQSGLTINYRVGAGEALPCADAAFTIVYCCDVLEHVSDPRQVIGEIARVLKPGGIFLYDTINRTAISKLVLIKLAQEWKATRILDVALHDWNMFIRPAELRAMLAQYGLRNRDMVGLRATGHPLDFLRAIRQLKRGAITYAELGRRLQYQIGKNRSLSYMGYADKPA